MYRSKQDVDKHVRNIFNRIQNQKERNLRGYTIAKLYCVVNDHDTAKRYLAMFLSEREKDAPAHKLMAQIHEKTGFSEKAIQSYKKSLELDESQKDIVLKICEIYCHLPVDPERARYWADRAEKLYPRNDTVFKLRECIVSGDGEQNNRDLEDLIAAELAHRPKDADLRIKLLKLYLDTERSKAAYDHAAEVEKQHPFSNNIRWYYCLTEVLETYVEDLGKEYTTELFLHMFHAYDRLVYLTLDEHSQRSKNYKRSTLSSSLLDSAAALNSFDQLLFKAHQHVENEGSWGSILDHYEGQLYFYMANFLLKRAQKDQGNLKEASRMSAGLFLIAYSFKPIDQHVSWYCRASETKQKELDLLHNHACFRLSQSGHMIRGMCKEDCSKWLPRIRQQVYTIQCREKIFQRVLSSKESLQAASAASRFMTAAVFPEFNAEFPDMKSLEEYDKVIDVLYPENLHHHVWLALQYYSLKQKVQPDYGFKLFYSLQCDTNNLSAASAESLARLDVEAFLYATVRTTALMLEESHTLNYGAYDSPSFQPAMISPVLCTDEQASWWLTAYQLYKNIAVENLGELRRILQHGIEVIRSLGNHGMDVSLIVHLAETFADQASEMKLQTECNTWQVLEKRAAHYWKAAIPMLEKLSNNQMIRIPKSRLFESHSPEPSTKELKKWIEEGRFYLACQAMNVNKHEEAIEAFDALKSPYASYYQAVIYKKLADEECNQPREQITSEMRSKHIILLTRARDALYATLDRLHGDRKHPLNQVLSDQIEDVETKLARIDPDMSQRHDFDALTDESLSSQNSDERNNSLELPHRQFSSGHAYRRTSGFSRSRNLLNSTPHAHAPYASSGRDSADVPVSRHREEHIRPSPERLDAQMRSLAFSHDAVIKTIMDQNKALIDSHHSIVQALQQNKMAVEEVKSQLEELQKQIGKCSISQQRRHRRRPRLPSSQLQVNEGEMRDDNDEEPNEDDYDGYYYEEPDYDDACEEHDNVYGDRSLQNEYPYGNITGLQGRSTVTYAPPPGSRNANQASGYAAYYQQPHPQMVCPVNSSTPVQSRPVHPQSLGSGYFGSSGPISASLPFSEGQKLPQFNFGTGIPPLGGPFSSPQMYMERPSVFSRLEPPTAPMPMQNFTQSQQQTISGHVPNDANNVDHPSQQPVATAAASGGVLPSPTYSVAETPAVANPVSVYTVPSTPAHAFQIPMPAQTVASNSLTAQDAAAKESVSSVVPPTVSPIPKFTDASPKQLNVVDISPQGNTKPNVTENSSYKEDEDYVGPDFKPVIPLPDEVEVKTGEEEEKVLFQERAKLFRFSDKEWKERGVGYVKILWHEKMEYVRILMRRDQILKICANHYIQPDMSLTAVKNSNTAWIWAAQDFADEEVRTEQFCIRFKTAEIASAFKREFENAQALLKNVKKPPPTKPVIDVANQSNNGKPDEGFGDKFKPKPGSWSCSTCMISNKSEQQTCVACETPKPGSTVQAKKPVASAFQMPSAQPTGGLLPPPASEQASSLFAVSNSSAKSSDDFSGPQTIFKFPTESKHATSADGVGSFAFGISGGATSTPSGQPSGFVMPTGANLQTSTSSPQPAFVFGNKNVSSLPKQAGFIFGASSLEKDKPVAAAAGPASSLLSAMANKHLETDAADHDASKVSYGGFTFTSSPTIKQPATPPEVQKSPLKPTVVKEKADGAKDKDASPKPNPFSGFSFGSGKDASPKPNPFSGFSFGSGKFDNTSQSNEASADKPGFLKLAKEAPSFSSLATSTSATEAAFSTNPEFSGFKGTGETIFRSPKGNLTSPNQNDDFESSAEFKPVIPLPEIVNTRTGEEEEEKLFGERAKLFRLDALSNEWKERGIGEIKLLRHKVTKRCRVLMRREQVLKICANHYITGYMELKPKVTTNNSWVWSANDFSDGEIKKEILAVKFKTPEIGDSFSKVFQKCIEDAKHAAPSGSVNGSPGPPIPQDRRGLWECRSCHASNKADVPQCATCNTTKLELDEKPLLSELFKSKPGTWECPVCCLHNDSNVVNCAACEGPKPGSATKSGNAGAAAPLSELFKPKPGTWTCSDCCLQNDADKVNCCACESLKPSSATKSKITSAAPLGEMFKPKPGSWNCSVCCLQNGADKIACATCENPKTGDGVEPASAATSQVSLWSKPTSSAFKFPSTSTSSFVFGSSSTANDVNSLSNSISAAEDSKSTEELASPFENLDSSSSVDVTEFRFGSPQKYEFKFSGIRPKSPAKTPKSPRSLDNSKEHNATDEDSVSEVESDISFQPVIPLPEKIDVKTGEEDEDVLYYHRAKLFRWVDTEWKERGIGDIKILHHRRTQKIRLLMRRDQVLKICLNHRLTSELKFLVMDEKSWVWAAKDFAENEAREERFAIRFKNQEIANEFMQAVDKAKDILRGVADGHPAADDKALDSSTTSIASSSNELITSTPSISSTPCTPPSQFSFRLDNSTGSSSTPFSFGNKFGTSSSPSAAKTSLFGGVSSVKPSSSPPPPRSSEIVSAATNEDDLNVVFEKKPPQEKVEKACSLSLPQNFYLYEEAPECPGCRGCSGDNAAASDVEVIYEETATPEEVAKAVALKLPPNFYLYEKKPPCPGCRGCSDNLPDNLPVDASETKPTQTETKPSSEIALKESSLKSQADGTASNFGPFSSGSGSGFSLDFASLAKGISDSTAFKTSTDAFAFSGTGTKVFGADDDAQNSEEVSQGPEPHFEPVVPLPKLVEVKTGEEDEIKLYGQRAKLFRYDDVKREWKERGVGEIKLLKHKDTGHIRVLMRREQVYKIACNHRLTPDMHLLPLSSSEVAWVWTAMDFAEETGRLENFAVKFKTIELAKAFKKIFEDCQLQLSAGEVSSGTIGSKLVADVTAMSPQRLQYGENSAACEAQTPPAGKENNVKSAAVTQDSSEHSKSHGHDQSSEDDDDDEESVMFEKQITLFVAEDRNEYQAAGTGNLRVVYDDDVYGARIQFVTDDGTLAANHLIAMQTDLEIQGKQCFWSALDFSRGTKAVHRRFQASFSSALSVSEFEAIFKEGKDYARHSEILERPDDGSAEDYSDNGTGQH